MHGEICEHGLPMFSALCEYFDAGTSRCVLEGCGDSTVHRGCVLALLRSKLNYVKADVFACLCYKFCSFLLFSMLKFPVINIHVTVISHIC